MGGKTSVEREGPAVTKDIPVKEVGSKWRIQFTEYRTKANGGPRSVHPNDDDESNPLSPLAQTPTLPALSLLPRETAVATITGKYGRLGLCRHLSPLIASATFVDRLLGYLKLYHHAPSKFWDYLLRRWAFQRVVAP